MPQRKSTTAPVPSPAMIPGSQSHSGKSASFSTPIALDRDTFMRQLIAGLGHLNEGILGSDVAGGYIMNVGLSMGAAIEAEYKRFWGITDRPFTLDEYAHVIVDLKQKIQGNFSLVSKAPEKVVVRTTSCPFDAFVRQSPSLCFMTSSVFGGIAARNFGYAKVVLHKRIALGDDGCYVTIHLRRTPEAEAAVGKEYYPDVERASPDIAEQLRLMESVRALHRELGQVHSRWDEVVRGAADAIVVADGEGVVHFANARWRDLLGIEGEELIGGDILRIVHPDDHKTMLAARQQVLNGTRVATKSVRLLRRDGQVREAVVSMGPVRADTGDITGILGIVHDVTEEREAARLKDDFLNAASHELRTPVTTIRVLSEILLRMVERGDPLDPQELARRLRTIHRQTDRLTMLGTDLLDAARLRQGKLAVRREPVVLGTLVAEVVTRARNDLLPGDQHTLSFQTPAAEVIVAVERPRIEQILTNLIENAAKYSPDGGEIALAVAVNPGTAAGDAGTARVTVSDAGIGIPAAEVGKLFAPFYRASNATGGHFSGLGLGLYLCKAAAEAHGGDLAVESVEGGGSTFTLTLPLYSPDRDGGETGERDE